MYIDKNSPIPVYYQLKNIISEKIRKGEYSPGSSIPSERELSNMLNISRMTVRQAINQLVAENILYKEKGKGTFVSKIKFEQRNIMSFSDIVKSRGLKPSTRILNFNKIIPSEDIREILELQADEYIYDLKRLRLADGIPIGIEEGFIPQKYCPELEKHDLTISLYKILKQTYQHTISCADNVVEASLPSTNTKKLLNISDNMPVISIKGTIYTVSGIKLFYEKSIYRSDEYKYNVRIYSNTSNNI